MKFRIVGLHSYNEVITFDFEVVTAPSKCYFCGCQVDVANSPTFLISIILIAIDSFISMSHTVWVVFGVGQRWPPYGKVLTPIEVDARNIICMSHISWLKVAQNLIAYSSLQYVVATEISDDSENIKNLSKNLSFQNFCVRITRILKLNEKTLSLSGWAPTLSF